MTRNEIITTSLRSSKAAGWPSSTIKRGNVTLTDSGLITAWRKVNAALIVEGQLEADYDEFRNLYVTVMQEAEAS